MPHSVTQYRRTLGDHVNWSDKQQGNQKKQNERIQRLAAQPGNHTGNRDRQCVANAAVQLLSVLSSIRNNNTQPAITSRKADTLAAKQRIAYADNLYRGRAVARAINREMRRSPRPNTRTEKSPQTQEEIALPPSVSGYTGCSDNRKSVIDTVLCPFEEALHGVSEFISKNDPLKFPGAAANPLDRYQLFEKEGKGTGFIENIGGNVVELGKKQYSVLGGSDSTHFVNAGKEALAKFYESYNSKNPDLKNLARNILREKIKERFHLDIDPDTYDFIFFGSTEYSGEDTIKSIPRIKKMLTEWLFINFSADVQDNLVDMDAFCGIYPSAIKNKKEYNSKDALSIKPTEFIQLTWDIDFYNYAREKITASLSNNKDAHIKKLFIETIKDLDVSDIKDSSVRDVLNGIGVLHDNNVSVTLFDINGYDAANAFIIRNNDNGQVTIYFPESDFKFMSFQGDFYMREWLTNFCATKKNREMIASHFTIYNKQDGVFYYGVDAWLDSINEDHEYYDRIAINDTPVSSENFFDFLHDQIKDKTLSDLDSMIKSDAEVRRDMWEGMIDASNVIPNPVSPFLSLGMHIEHLLEADTYEERMVEFNSIKNDMINLVAMALMDRAIKYPDTEGYAFIEKVKSGVDDEDMLYKEPGNYDDDKTELIYDKEQDCYRVKRGAVFGKLCSQGTSRGEVEVEMESLSQAASQSISGERVSDECERIIQTWHLPPESSEAKLSKLIELSMNQSDGSPALDEYIEDGSDGVNNYLRYGTDDDSGQYARDAAELIEAYPELNAYDDFSYRVMFIPHDRVEALMVGDVVADKGFASSSALLENAKDWFDSSYFDTKRKPGIDSVLIVYDKDVPKKIAGNDFLTDHILLQPGEKIKISSKSTFQDEGKTITVLGVSAYEGETPPVDIYSGATGA